MEMRTKELFPIGELPPLGVLPEKMIAWTIRTERLGVPMQAFQQEVVDLPSPGRHELVVANMCAGINYNGIWAALGKPKNVIAGNGDYGDEKQPFQICGSESAGIVYAVGEDVHQFQVGDFVTVGASQFDVNCKRIQSGEDPINSPTYRVWGYESNWGAFAQFSKVMDIQCAHIPKGMSWAEASSFTAAGVAVYRMMTHWVPNTVKKGDVVLIYGGTGSVGSMAIQIAAYYGAIPIAVVSSEERGAICMKLGAKGYINRKKYHHWGSLDDYLNPEKQKVWTYEAMKFKRAIWKIVGEKKSPAIVIEHPGRDTMPTSLFVCDRNGMVVTCGATSSYQADIDLRYLWLGQKRIQGSHSGTPEDYDAFARIVENSTIRPYIGKIFPWEELPLAHQMLYEGTAPDGKMIINIGNKA